MNSNEDNVPNDEEVEEAIEVLQRTPLDENQQDELRHEVTIQGRSGPLPNPYEFEQYEKTLPGAADRIMTMAEEEQKNRHKFDSKEQEKYHENSYSLTKMSMITSLCISLGGSISGVLISIFGNSTTGIIIAIVSVLPVITNAFKDLFKNEGSRPKEKETEGKDTSE